MAAIRPMPGNRSRSARVVSRQFGVDAVSPVTFPPGRARSAASPLPIGSPLEAITMGIVLVAFLAAIADGVPRVTIRSTLRRRVPPRVRETFGAAVGRSILDGRGFDPRRIRVPGDLFGRHRNWRRWIRRYCLQHTDTIDPGCCARAVSGHAAAAPPSSVMNSRRFMSDMGLPPAGAHTGHDTANDRRALARRVAHRALFWARGRAGVAATPANRVLAPFNWPPVGHGVRSGRKVRDVSALLRRH